MFIGTDPYIAALHQNDVQLVGPIFAEGRIIAWAGVEAHETDVGGMDFASWSPKAREVYQEGLRIPCVKLVDRGELRDDVLEMILAASRLPAQLGLDIRAFIATLNVARSRIGDLVRRYDADTVVAATGRMIAVSEARMRARIAELPDGTIHAVDFLEHDGHTNVLYKLDLHLTKTADTLRLDFSGSSKQAPGFVNATRAGLLGGVAGGVLPTLAYDLQWNQGALAPVEIVAPDGLICTAMFPAPVGSATVETIWVVGNVVMQALNKLLSTSPKYRYRTQASSAGAMATFNLGGFNQFGEPFGLHLMDPLAAGSGAFASKDGVSAGGPITSAMSGIADVERNEQVSPLFYFTAAWRAIRAAPAASRRHRRGSLLHAGRHRNGAGARHDPWRGSAEFRRPRRRLARRDDPAALWPAGGAGSPAGGWRLGNLRPETGADGHDRLRYLRGFLARRRRLGRSEPNARPRTSCGMSLPDGSPMTPRGRSTASSSATAQPTGRAQMRPPSIVRRRTDAAATSAAQGSVASTTIRATFARGRSSPRSRIRCFWPRMRVASMS